MSATADWVKDPNALLDFTFDWTDWLVAGDSISTFNVSVKPSDHTNQIVVEQTTEQDGNVVLWLSQGRKNTRYFVECSIVTAEGRRDDRTKILKVINT